MFAKNKTREVWLMNCKKLFTIVFSVLLCMVTILPAHAATNPFAAMEASSYQALDAAIKAGTVPAGTTIFDCMFATGEDGVTRVVKFKDKDGNWTDVVTQKKAVEQEKASGPADKSDAVKSDSAQKLSEDALAEYAAEVFRLVNVEREKAGLDPLERDEELDSAAAIRAEELSRNYSHTRPDGTSFYTVMGVEKNYNYAENGGATGKNPQDQMRRWLNSDGHRSNILDTNEKGYTAIGIGVFQAENGRIYWCQLFYRPI